MTYAESQKEILAYLQEAGWAIKEDLKIPHATRGCLRLWFKSQAVLFSVGRKHELKNARTISYTLDIRKMTPRDFLSHIDRLELEKQ